MSPPLKAVWPPLLVVVASTAFGELLETPQQMEPRRADSVTKVGAGYTHVWIGKTVAHTGWFLDGKAAVETFWFNDHRKMTSQEIGKFMKPYDWMRHSREWIKGRDASFMTLSYRGEPLAVIMYLDEDNSLSIWLSAVFESVFLTSEQARPTRSLRDYRPQPEKERKNDCMIVATENLHRLAPNSAWSNILMFKYVIDGVPQGLGHAVAVWKITPNGKVFAADDSGTFELNTRSTDAKEILLDLSLKYSAIMGERVWLDGHFAVEQ